MLENERLNYIIDKIEREGSVQLQDLCRILNTSGSTIRRDLDKLEQENILKRVYGGAVKAGNPLNIYANITTDQRLSLNTNEKNLIAQKCAEMISDKDFVYLDGGSTFIDVIRYLEGKKVTVITPNDLIRTKAGSTVTVIVIGGRNLPEFKINAGPIALKFLESVHFDKAFIGCSGIDTKSRFVYTSEVDTAQLKEAAIKKSIHSYLAFDSSKIDVRGFYNFADMNDFTSLIIPEHCTFEDAPNVIRA